MTKITSTEALLDRIREAYPLWVQGIERVRERAEAQDYSGIYEMLREPCHIGKSFSADRIIDLVDSVGQLIPEKFAALLAEAKQEIETRMLEPLRYALKDDFLESYEFEPAYWEN